MNKCWVCSKDSEWIDSMGDYICNECKTRFEAKIKMNITFKEVKNGN